MSDNSKPKQLKPPPTPCNRAREGFSMGRDIGVVKQYIKCQSMDCVCFMYDCEKWGGGK